MARSAFGVEGGALAKRAAPAHPAPGPAQDTHPPHEPFYERHPAETAAATAAGAVAAAKGVRVGNGLRLSRRLAAPGAAERVAGGLARHRSATVDPLNPLRTRAEQNKVYRTARKATPEVGPLGSGVNRYSSTYKRAGAIRREANAAGPAPHPLLHPQRAEARLHAKNFHTLIEGADRRHTPTLHRAMHVTGRHQVGDTVDFGRLSSWSSNPAVADAVNSAHATSAAVRDATPGPLRKPVSHLLGVNSPPGAKPAVYHLPGGSVKAVNLSGASRSYAQNEWLTGGKHVVTSVKNQGGVMHYHLRPHTDNALAKAAAAAVSGRPANTAGAPTPAATKKLVLRPQLPPRSATIRTPGTSSAAPGVRLQTQVSKAFDLVPYTGPRARSGKARYSVHDTPLGRMKGSATRRQEFRRAASGGVHGNYRAHQMRDTHFARMHGDPVAGYRTTAAAQAHASPHRVSFHAGERLGRGGGVAAHVARAHPGEVGAGLQAGLVLGGGAAVVGHDLHAARKAARKAASEAATSTTVAKLSTRAGRAGLVAGLTGLAGVQVGINEAQRRAGNKGGAQVSVGQQYRHPYKASYATNAGIQTRMAQRLDARAATEAKPRRKAAQQRLANRYRWSAGNNANAAREGGVASMRYSNKGNTTYDKHTQYAAPPGPFRVGLGKAAAMGPLELRRRRKRQAALSAAGATIGLGALGLRGAAPVARRLIANPAKAARVAARLENQSTGALALGAGIGAVSGFNQAAVYRAESRAPEPPARSTAVRKGLRATVRSAEKASADFADITAKAKKLIPTPRAAALGAAGAVTAGSGALFGGSYLGSRAGSAAGRPRRRRPAQRPGAPAPLPLAKAADPLVRRYGLRGAPGTDVDRDTRQQIWQARAKHLNRRRDRWEHARQAGNVAEQGSKAVAGGAGAVVLGAQMRDMYAREHDEQFTRANARTADRVRRATRGHPVAAARGSRAVGAVFHGKPGFGLVATGAAATASAAGARQVRLHAQRRVARYSSASGGIAAGTARRMQDYGRPGGPVAKAERRFSPVPNTKAPLYLARHSPETVALRRLQPRPLPLAAAIRAGVRGAR